MIRNELQRVFAQYPSARQEKFASHPLAVWIRQELPNAWSEATPEFPDILWAAFPGLGRWADAPWLAAFDPLVTESAQDGYYPVYLFTRTLNSVYLSMNQGMSQLRVELGVEAKETLSHRASILRNRLSGDFEKRFSESPIDLRASGPSSRLAFYEPGHAFGVQYKANAIPSDSVLLNDIGEMLRLYALATIKGGTQELDTTGHAVAELGEEYLARANLEEKRRLRLHFRVERNPNLAKLAKEAHGYVCQVCGFDFQLRYGELGKHYIEAHHITPLSELPPNRPVTLSPRDDFAVVCANCHRMIHKPGAPQSFDAFRKLFASVGR